MSITIVNYGDSIAPGSQPVLVFPIVANQILAAIDLISTITGTIASTGFSFTESDGVTGSGIIDATTVTATDTEDGTPVGANITNPGPGGHGLVGYQANKPIAGQLANLAAFVSKDGGAFAAGVGTLTEIANGYYRYIPSTTETDNPPTPDSSNTGTVVVRIRPTDPIAVANFYIEETLVNFRLRAPGKPQVILSPASGPTFLELLQPTTDDLKNFIRMALRDLLGNQMTNKPTFRKD